MFFTLEDGEWTVAMRHGLVKGAYIPDAKIDLVPTKQTRELKAGEDKFYGQFDVIIPVMHKHEALAYLLIGDMNEDLIENTNKAYPVYSNLS